MPIAKQSTDRLGRRENATMASADQSMSPPIDAEGAMSAGEFVLKKLFAEFVALSERKLQNIATQPLVGHPRDL